MKHPIRVFLLSLAAALLLFAPATGSALAAGADLTATPPSNAGELAGWLEIWNIAFWNVFGDEDPTNDVYTNPESLTFTVDPATGSAVITGVVGNREDFPSLAIPPYVTEGDAIYTVRGIGPGAFSGCTNVLFAILPNTVEQIGAGAFTGCATLHTLSIPFLGTTRQSPQSLGWLFSGGIPVNLRQVFLTSGYSLAENAFADRRELMAVVFQEETDADPDAAYSIGKDAFLNCIGLTTIAVPSSVTSIEEGAFRGCYGLTEMTLPFIGSAAGSTGTGGNFGWIFGQTGDTPGDDTHVSAYSLITAL